jgi:hypothetical protein
LSLQRRFIVVGVGREVAEFSLAPRVLKGRGDRGVTEASCHYLAETPTRSEMDHGYSIQQVNGLSIFMLRTRASHQFNVCKTRIRRLV